MGLQVQPTSVRKAFFDLQGEWIRVDSTSDTIKSVLQRFPECRSIRFEVFTNELSAMELKPLRPPPKRNIWLSAAIFVVKTVLAYEVIASVADFALRTVGVRGASKEDEEQSAFDDVLRALQRMDSEELEKLNQRADQELSRAAEGPEGKARRARSSLQTKLGPPPPPQERLGAKQGVSPRLKDASPPSAAASRQAQDTPAVMQAAREQGAGDEGPGGQRPEQAAEGGAGAERLGSRAQLRRQLQGPGAEEALQDIIQAGDGAKKRGGLFKKP